MPGPSSSTAPSFLGESADLLEFFSLFEGLALSCGLKSDEKCRAILRYVNTVTKRLWMTLSGYDSLDYDTFKSKILEQYPGADKGTRYTYRDLERLILTYAESNISTETELMQYSREFRPIAVWLIKNGKLSTRERDMWFWHRLPTHARQAISRRLELQNPTTYSWDEPPDYEKTVTAGRFVFSDDAFDATFDDPITNRL